jgi:MFS family permease/tetratricopeptide (TPR) repeat protein
MERKLSIILGWLTFVIAFVVYYLTLAPTISYWDCSEFITCANKLEVGHAPGAPLFMLLGRVFSFFAGNDVSKIAHAVNSLSALASAFTIMFLFWTIEWFGKKLIKRTSIDSSNAYLYILLGSLIGALSFAFTDTFWFSAVEGEVYATSSFFNAIVFWAILKWESNADKQKSDNWILLIFFLMGLSIGVHLLNLLAIPAIVMVYYFKRYQSNTKGILKALVFSIVLLVVLVFMLVPGIAKMAAYFDLFFVNQLSLLFYSGVIFYLVLIGSLLVFLIWYSVKYKKQLLQTIVLSLTVFFIGYSSYASLVIRSLSDPYIDITNVENVFGLVDYLNREQYGKRPLVYGNNYNSPIIKSIERNSYKTYGDKYVKSELNPKYVFDKRTETLFPRMASLTGGHDSEYKRWINIKGKPVKVSDRNGGEKVIMVPTFTENIAFFLKYQLGYMYFRYFMWNFSGRQNNIQGFGDLSHGNWISGIPLIDEMRLGPQDNLPDKFANNPARNKYFMIPLIFGLIGLIFQYKKDKQSFFVAFLYFFFAGIAIVLYVNEIPITPRERDYVYVGSFYAFSIWIGLSAIAIIDLLKRKNKYINFSVLLAMFFLLPVNLISQNWDDHDRSGRWVAHDFSFNVLNSCEKNAILFTAADNDSYPIWYAQEVEGYRRDIRPVLTEFLPVDWYINQLSNNYPEMGSIPISFTDDDFLNGNRMYLPIADRVDSYVDFNEVIDFIKSDNPRTKVTNYDNSKMDYIPTRKIKIPINKENFIKSCTSFKYNVDDIPDEITINLTGNHLFRNELLILDIILKNDWKRPVYFLNTNTLSKIGLDKYVHREGLSFRLLPFAIDSSNKISNSDYLYTKFMKEFRTGGIDDESVMLDWTNVRIVSTMRIHEQFNNAARLLIAEGDNKRAVELLDKCLDVLPNEKIPYGLSFPQIIESYNLAGEKEKAEELYQIFRKNILDELNYYKRFDDKMIPGLSNNIRMNLYLLQKLEKVKFVKTMHKNEVINDLNEYYGYFYKILG